MKASFEQLSQCQCVVSGGEKFGVVNVTVTAETINSRELILYFLNNGVFPISKQILRKI